MAEWKQFDLTWGRSIYYCSECEESVDLPTAMGKPIYKYCPMCGAKMNADRKTEPTISKMEQVEDETQTQLTARCLNCNNAKVCKEKHWDGCVYEPKDEKTCETCRHWKYIAHEWQCEACKCQGYEPKYEPQTDCAWK